MDGRRFDELTKFFDRRRSRRAALSVVPALGFRRFLFASSACDPSNCRSNHDAGCGCPTLQCPAGATPVAATPTPAALTLPAQPPCGDCSCRAAPCVAAGGACATDHDCCDGSCVATASGKVCDCIGTRDCKMEGGSCGCNPDRICTCRVAPACLPLGATCKHDQDCCHGGCACAKDVCQCACLDVGAACGSAGDCCSNQCGSNAGEGSIVGLTCRSATCQGLGQPCKKDGDCCEGACGSTGCKVLSGGCAGRC